MPYTEKQNRLFRAIEHGWSPPAKSGIRINRSDATKMAHEGVKRSRGGLALYAAGGYADGGATDNLPLYMMPQYQQGAGAVANLPLTAIEQMRPLGMADGGAVDFSKMDPRSAVLARINQQIRQRSSLSASQDATRSILGRLSPARSPQLSAFAPRGYIDSMGSYPLPDRQVGGYARGGSVPPNKRTVDMLEDGRVVVRHSFYGRTPGEASHMLSAHRRADRSFDDALRGKPYKGVHITARRLASGGYAGGGYADGGEADGNFIERHPLITGAAASLAALRPRHLNKLSRPFMRALARPSLGVEAVSQHPLSSLESDARFNFARTGTQHDYRDLPVWKGQGAWQGENGMEYNPLYVQDLPRAMGRLDKSWPHMTYAAQMGENLEQAATPVSRFVPHLWNTSEDANALMVHGVDNERLRRLAEILGPDVVTAHRPGNKAMVFPTDDRPIKSVRDEINASMHFPSMRYGRSDPGNDRALLARKPLGYEDSLYSDWGAEPRDKMYDDIERSALRYPRSWSDLSQVPE